MRGDMQTILYRIIMIIIAVIVLVIITYFLLQVTGIVGGIESLPVPGGEFGSLG